MNKLRGVNPRTTFVDLVFKFLCALFDFLVVLLEFLSKSFELLENLTATQGGATAVADLAAIVVTAVVFAARTRGGAEPHG